MLEFKGIVYIATNIINNKVYIGITSTSLHNRKTGHLREAKKGNKKPFYNALRKNNGENFIWSILEDNIFSEDSLYKREIYYIRLYKATDKTKGYNISEGGKNPRLKGNNHPLYKIGHTKETKQNISKNHADCSGSKNSRYIPIDINDLIIYFLNTDPYYKALDIENRFNCSIGTLRTKLKNYNVDLYNFISLFRKNRSHKPVFSKLKYKKEGKYKNKVMAFSNLKEIQTDFVEAILTMKQISNKYGFTSKEIQYAFERYCPELLILRKNNTQQTHNKRLKVSNPVSNDRIIELINQGYSVKEIANQLNVSKYIIRNRIKNFKG